jgi:hypothetical protein
MFVSHFLMFEVWCLLALPIGKRLLIGARFGLGDKILAHSLAKMEMTTVHKIKKFTWM